MREGKYYYAQEDGVCIIKPVGAITMPLCAGIDSFIDRILNEKPVRDIVIDMTETEYIDSTNLGVLLRISRHYSQSTERRPTIVSAEGIVDRMLHDLHFDKLFDIIDIIDRVDTLREKEFKDIPGDEKKSGDLRRIIAKAHYDLMSVDEKNRKQFEDIVALLGEDRHTQKHS